MPRERKEAPNATVRMAGKQDQRREVELEYDEKFPERKHFWDVAKRPGLQKLVAKGLVEVTKDKTGVEIENGISVLCSMDRGRWEETQAAGAEASYAEAKELRGRFSEFDVPLRQYENFKSPREKE